MILKNTRKEKQTPTGSNQKNFFCLFRKVTWFTELTSHLINGTFLLYISLFLSSKLTHAHNFEYNTLVYDMVSFGTKFQFYWNQMSNINFTLVDDKWWCWEINPHRQKTIPLSQWKCEISRWICWFENGRNYKYKSWIFSNCSVYSRALKQKNMDTGIVSLAYRHVK